MEIEEEILSLEYKINKMMNISENEYNEIYYRILSYEVINGTCSSEKAEDIINCYIDELRLKELKND